MENEVKKWGEKLDAVTMVISVVLILELYAINILAISNFLLNFTNIYK
jgi:hypothetical protein